MTPDLWCTAARHGDRRAYRHGCRCTDARADHAAFQYRRRADLRAGRPRTIDATGSRRRIQALMAAGWSGPMLAEMFYVNRSMMSDHFVKTPTITAVWAARIADLYNRIGLDEGPSPWTKARAARNRWPPPIEWGDDIDDPKAGPLDLDNPRLDRFHGAAPMSDIEMLVDTGATWDTACARLGISRNTLEQRLIQRGRLDLSRKLARASQVEYGLRRPA